MNLPQDNEALRQAILMYVRDNILDEVITPVRKIIDGIRIQQRDFTLIDKLVPRYTDGLLSIFQAEQTRLKAEMVQAVKDGILETFQKYHVNGDWLEYWHTNEEIMAILDRLAE